ncbi:MAG: UxaA family hydrolase [Candidatus Geothermarchaeales archaeon]
MSIRSVVMNPRDNVATALADVEAGTRISVRVGQEVREIVVRQSIPFGHKFALRRIERDQSIYKYGEVIGRATEPISEGEHVHVQNVESLRLGRGEAGRK